MEGWGGLAHTASCSPEPGGSVGGVLCGHFLGLHHLAHRFLCSSFLTSCTSYWKTDSKVCLLWENGFGPLNSSSFVSCTMFSFVSRRCWRDTGAGVGVGTDSTSWSDVLAQQAPKGYWVSPVRVTSPASSTHSALEPAAFRVQKLPLVPTLSGFIAECLPWDTSLLPASQEPWNIEFPQQVTDRGFL